MHLRAGVKTAERPFFLHFICTPQASPGVIMISETYKPICMKSPALLLPLFVLSFSFLFAHPASAQLKGFSFGPYIETARPRGNFAETNGRALGAGISADFKLMKRVSAMGSFGFLHFGRNSARESVTQAVNALPIRVGVKYKLPLVYVKFETGTARLKDNTGATPIFSPGIGFRILGLDIQGSYETWLNHEAGSFTSLKVAYHF